MSLSSPIKDLQQLRKELQSLNLNLFALLERRRSICLEIQSEKTPNTPFLYYDPEREFELFQILASEIKKLSFKELFAFSLIIEAHSQINGDHTYPSWSKKVHLNVVQSEDLFYQINPLLLKLQFPELFERLNLSSEFIFLKDFLFFSN